MTTLHEINRVTFVEEITLGSSRDHSANKLPASTLPPLTTTQTFLSLKSVGVHHESSER